MLKNLQIEWMKIKNYRVFQVFSILYLLGILLIIYIFYKVYINIIGRMQESMTGVKGKGSDFFHLFSDETIWRTVCFSTSFLLYLPGMIIINLFINEVNFKTHRQNIIDGWKRETFIYTKINLILCMSVVITIMNFFATLIMAQITHTDLSYSAGIQILGLSFVQTVVYLMFALLLATIFRRSGIAIIVFFIYGLVFELLFVWLLNRVVSGLGNFLPLQVGDSLVTPSGAKSWLYEGLPGLEIMLPAALAFIALYIYLTVRKYRYDDL
jgi:ABC-2 type transport system permease protein